MITQIRKQFKGTASTLVIILTVLALSGAFSIPILIRQLSTSGPWALLVNKHEISYADFSREVSDQQERIASFRAQYGQYADVIFQSMGMTLNPQSLARETLIREALISQVGSQIGIYMDPEYTSGRLHDQSFATQELAGLVPPFLFASTGEINKSALKGYLRRRGLTISAFEKKLEEVLSSKISVSLAFAGMYVPTFEMRQEYIANSLVKQFSIWVLSLDTFVKEEQKKELSSSEIKEFFDQQNSQSKRYFVPEKRSGMLWKFTSSSYGIAISDEAIEKYYDGNKPKYVDQPGKVEVRTILVSSADEDGLEAVAAQEKITKIYQEVTASPDLFADIAKKESDDKETALKGGLLKPFAKGEKDKAFERAAFLLPRDGAISEIVQTPRGYEIVQRIGKAPATFKPLSEVRSSIKKQLVKGAFNEKFTKDMKRVAELENLDARESALQSIIEQGGGRSEAVDDISNDDSPIAQRLFKLGSSGIAFYVDDNTGIAVKLMEVKKQYVPSIDSLEETVRNDLYEFRAKKELKRALDEAKKAASGSAQALKDIGGISFEQTGMIKKSDTKAVDSLKKRGIAVSKAFELEKIGAVNALLEGDNGYIVRLDKIEPFDVSEFQASVPELANQSYSKDAGNFIEGFIASLHRNAIIETNKSLITPQE